MSSKALNRFKPFKPDNEPALKHWKWEQLKAEEAML